MTARKEIEEEFRSRLDQIGIHKDAWTTTIIFPKERNYGFNDKNGITDDYHAMVEVDYPYKSIRVSVTPLFIKDWKKDRDPCKKTLLHEAFHVLLSDMRRNADHLPNEYKKEYHNLEEQCADHLTNLLWQRELVKGRRVA